LGTSIWETVVDDSVVGYPLGEKALVLLPIIRLGFMSVNISASNRFVLQLMILSQATQNSWR